MGVMLREVLKAFCAGNQWCYAVFWKIGCRNTKLLMWEECHYESTPHPQIPFGEWEGYWGSSETISQLGIQAGGVQLLINKLMMNSQVNVVGEGLVGQAAFTGNHQWFLALNHIGDAHPPEVQNEVHLQFSAGMQTVAVIPVLPHGVIQLGSSSAIVENIGFVNYVKSLILSLGCVPGALLPENYGAKESTDNTGVPVSNGMLASVSASGIFKATSSSSLSANGSNQQSCSSQPSRLVGQLLGSLGRQIQHNAQATASTSQNHNLTQMLGKFNDDHCKQNFNPAMKLDLPFGGQQENGVVSTDVIPASSNTWLNQQASLYGSRSAFHYQPVIDQSITGCSSFKFIEQKILADATDHALNNVNESNADSFVVSQLKANGGLTGGSLPTQYFKRSELHGGMNSQISSVSISNQHKSADFVTYSTHLAGTGLRNANSSKAEEVPSTSLVDQVTSSYMLSGASDKGHSLLDAKHTPINLASRKGKVDNDLFQALNSPLTHLDQHMPLSGQIPGCVNDCQKHDYGDMTLKSSDAKFEDGCMQPPSGDDLFDILGVDFKNKLLNGDWNNLLADGHNMVEGSSMSMNAPYMNSDFYSVNEGTLDSSTFSGMGTGHLLDAVVSRAHSVSKQISDDNVSCRTTLTKICSSSIPTISPSCGQVNMSNLVQGELLGLPKYLSKAGTVASSSFQSGCSNGDGGNCSRTTSIYGSHISSWVEQGHNVKRDGSVSTAYSKKNDETKSNRKRLKPGENPRPRPKDRQMIQDRVKELREIVPNGAKCSIDALLERTIKHMLFLQSVTKHADKLKQTGESKIISKEGGLLLKDNFEGGATWAFEVGSQSMVCPIIVEDLNPPRQMLVEMLCEERGFFLEIADLIRGLGLTILKGVMESRNDKIWARFAVEANRDVTRMEIFMSLVRLLGQTVKGSTLANTLDNNNMMVHHSFPQSTSIPATGRPSTLQ